MCLSCKNTGGVRRGRRGPGIAVAAVEGWEQLGRNPTLATVWGGQVPEDDAAALGFDDGRGWEGEEASVRVEGGRRCRRGGDSRLGRGNDGHAALMCLTMLRSWAMTR